MSNTKPLEKEIEKKVVKWAKDNRWLAIKYTPIGARGWPDRIFISPAGVHVWVEFKRPGNTPTELQVYRMKELTDNNCKVMWSDDAVKCITALGAIG